MAKIEDHYTNADIDFYFVLGINKKAYSKKYKQSFEMVQDYCLPRRCYHCNKIIDKKHINDMLRDVMFYPLFISINLKRFYIFHYKCFEKHFKLKGLSIADVSARFNSYRIHHISREDNVHNFLSYYNDGNRKALKDIIYEEL